MKMARSGIGWLIAEYGTLGLSLAATIYFTRALENPTATLGLFAGFETVVSLVTVVVASGLGTALTKRVSERTDESEYITAALSVTVVFVVIASLCILLVSPLAVGRFQIGYGVIAFLIAMVCAKPIRNMLGSSLRGFSKVGTTGGLSFLEMLIRVGIQVPLVTVGVGLLGLVSGAAVGMVVASVAALYLLPVGFNSPERRHFQSLFEFGKYSFFQGLAGRFYDNIDIVVIIWVLGESATGQYAIPFRFGLALAIFSGSISKVTFPEISRSAAAQNPERIEQVLTDGIIFSTLLAIPGTVGLAILAEPIIVALFTEEFAAGALVAVVAVAIQIPDGIRSVLTSGIDGMDRPDLTLHADLIIVVINLVLDLLLVPMIGITGAAIASFIAITSATVYLGYTLFSKFQLPARAFPVRPLAAEVVAALVMGGVVYWLRETLTPETLLQSLPTLPVAAAGVGPLLWIFILVAAGAVVYFAVLLIISGSVRQRIIGIVNDFTPA